MRKQNVSNYYPWLVIGLSAAFLFYKYVLQVSPGIMTDDLMRAFDICGAQLGNLAAVYFYGYLGVQLFAGPLMDRYSARKVTPLAILVCASGAYLFATANSLTMALFARILMGVGVGFATVNYIKMASVLFKPSQFAFISGLLVTAAMAGAVFGETPLVVLLNHIGWRHMLLLVSMLGVVIAALFFWRVKDIVPAFSSSTASERFTWHSVGRMLTNPQNWLITFYSGLAFSPLAVLGGLWGNPFLEVAHHLSLTKASFLLSWLFIGLGLGSPVLGWVSDKWGSRQPVMQLSVLLSCIVLLSVIYLPALPAWLVGILLFLFGFFTGAFMLGFALAKEINNLALAATVVAMINTGNEIFGAVTEPLVGKFLDWHSHHKVINGVHVFSVTDYHLAFLVLPLYLVGALVLLRFIKEKSVIL